jgi:hypothetical protein
VTVLIRIRRAIRGRLRLAVPLLVVVTMAGGHQRTAGAEPALSPNLLDQPIVDLAILPSPGREANPSLLILEAEPRSPSVARLSIMRRDAAWESSASTVIDLGAEDLTARWLVGLDEDRFALIATSPQTAPGTGRAVLVVLTFD